MTDMERSVGVVIGASSGIGASVVELLAQKGHRIIAASRRGGCPSLSYAAIACDIRQAIDLSRLINIAQGSGWVA